MNESSEVDIRSCILSLIDLYTHWLTQPIHTLLLQHMVRSVVMLSDLFALVCAIPIFGTISSHNYPWVVGTCVAAFLPA